MSPRGVLYKASQLMAGFMSLSTLGCAAAQADTCATQHWPLWQYYAHRFIQADGRMLLFGNAPNQSSSEAQSYAMFFALVDNDPELFDKLWRWTRDNLAASDIETHLPAWLWGLNSNGDWGVLDANSASDSNLWIAYALLEANRLWNKPDYHDEAQKLLANVEAKQVIKLPGLGKMLIPGTIGFNLPDHLWRLNPSYMPLPLMRRFDKETPSGPWQEVAENTVKLVSDARTNPKGYVADWVGYRGTAKDSGLFVTDPVTGQLGSYDAIRVYLWIGITPASDPLAASMRAHLEGMTTSTASRNVPPEKVQVLSGVTEGDGHFGFSAALIPYFQAKGQPWLALSQQRRVEEALEKAQDPTNPAYWQPLYYDFMLSLFALGWSEQRYQFQHDGTVKLSWEAACVTHAAR
ncbi:MAG: cellulose synthase complex periplasmic endoglucanase BcsZ [Pseudomonas sp.]